MNPATAPCETHVDGGPLCGAPAIQVVAIGCIHEHVSTKAVCDAHHRELDSQKIVCRSCRRGKQPHLCALYWRAVQREQVAS